MRVRFGEFVLDTDSRQLLRDGAEVHLQPKTFELLELLVARGPKALSKQADPEQLWPDIVVGDASLTVAVAELRAALGDDAKEPRFVRTVYGFGYAFAGEGETEQRRVGAPSDRRVAPRVLWEKRVIPLVEGENVLGRDEDATVRIDAPGVSRRHACIRVEGTGPRSRTSGARTGRTSGTGPSPITRRPPLPDDARFRLGRVLLVFRTSPEAGSTLTEHRG